MNGAKDWFRYHQIEISAIVIILTVVVLTLPFAGLIFGSADTLQVLIQAEATILGFVALIMTYNLTSIDSRLDRLEQQCFDCEMGGYLPRAKSLEKKIAKIKRVRASRIQAFGLMSTMMIISLLIALSALGLVGSYQTLVYLLSLAGLSTFGVAVITFVTILLGFTREFSDD
jgi:hypothetical protein